MESNDFGLRLRHSLPWFGLALVALVFIGISILEIPKLAILANRGVAVEARITGYDEMTHHTLYSYQFDGQTYAGNVLVKTFNAVNIPVGREWRVTVDPFSPERHSSGDALVDVTAKLKVFAFIAIALIAGLFLRLIIVR